MGGAGSGSVDPGSSGTASEGKASSELENGSHGMGSARGSCGGSGCLETVFV